MLFCIKMTAAIQVENIRSGMQTYEERFVLVKALSFDTAYKKIEKNKHKYETPYLNPYGRLVRWKIESLDDYFATDYNSPINFNNPEGIEVYSTLKKRKLTKERVWEGNL